MPAPPPLAYSARLDELEGCTLEFLCGHCKMTTYYPIRLAVQRLGPHHHLGAVLPRMVCKKCRNRPAEVHLNEHGYRRFAYGGSTGWSVQLIPPPPVSG